MKYFIKEMLRKRYPLGLYHFGNLSKKSFSANYEKKQLGKFYNFTWHYHCQDKNALMHIRKHTSKRFILALKSRTYITRSLKQEYQWLLKRLISYKFILKISDFLMICKLYVF